MRYLLNFLFIFVFVYANEFCLDFDKINKKLFEKKIQLSPSYYSSDYVEKQLKKEIFFAKKYNLSDKKIIAKIGAVDALYYAYIKYLKKKYAPNDKVLKSFYIEYKNEFPKITKVNVSFIKCISLDLADKIYEILKKNPNKFQDLAKKYSLDENIKYENMDLKKFPYKSRKFIRNAKIGDISKPIIIGKYYFIYKLDKKVTLQPTYENLKPYIKDILVTMYVKHLMEKMYRNDE
jgi:parvulin-like peptidyl-prolyl isomerase